MLYACCGPTAYSAYENEPYFYNLSSILGV